MDSSCRCRSRSHDSRDGNELSLGKAPEQDDGVLNSVAAMGVILAVAGSAFAVPREGRNREQAVVKMVKKIVRALGDGVTIPKP
jgi:hypothetical protein